jgi:hypothetical protein
MRRSAGLAPFAAAQDYLPDRPGSAAFTRKQHSQTWATLISNQEERREVAQVGQRCPWRGCARDQRRRGAHLKGRFS